MDMPDGKRKRRHSQDQAKRRWYALHRARRFRRRFWLGLPKSENENGSTNSRESSFSPSA
jgi:hypothetical protein